eukprot:m.68728 g.68728  ORF g.68728 m.68728 type:complete len:318 (-) comp18343_c0_seq3:109-1062(-)
MLGDVLVAVAGGALSQTLELGLYCALVLVVVWRWRRNRTVVLIHPHDLALIPALRRKVAEMVQRQEKLLDLSELPFRTLPSGEFGTVATLCEEVRLHAGAPGYRLDALHAMPKLSAVTVAGPIVVPSHWLAALDQLRELRHVDLTGCRVKDTNNSATGLCSGRDLFTWCQTRPTLVRVAVPALAAVEIGVVAKVYPKANVAVVTLSQRVRLGDVLEMRRVAHSFAADSKHHWASTKSPITSIRTDSGEQLDTAAPAPRPQQPVRAAAAAASSDDDESDGDDLTEAERLADEASQFAIKLPDVGRKGDRVFWCGYTGE